MSQTIYAAFADVEFAEKAAGALLDHGVLKEDLSVVANSADRQTREQEVGTRDPLGVVYSTGQGTSLCCSPVPGAVDAATPTFPYPAFAGPVDPIIVQDNQMDYTGTRTDKYDNDAVIDESVDFNRNYPEEVAKSGITTTTPEDAEVGALKGTGIGLGVGLLAGLAALIIPGVGFVFGSGALALAIGGAALTTASGAAVGGLVGYLKDQGVAESDAMRFQNAVGTGGALLAVSLPSSGIGLQEAELLLNKYRATEITSY